MIKLNMLDAWSGISKFFGKRSAQSYLNSGNVTFAVSGGCGSACGAGDGDSKPKPEENPDPKPTACGSACGAGDK